MDLKDLNLEKVIKKLPKNPNILGRKKYFNSAVIIPLIIKENQYHLLFQKRAENIRQGSEICFPGGGYDEKLDKTPLDTAIRETKEELGIRENDIKILGNFHTLVAHMGAIVDPFLAILKIDNIDSLNLNKTEVESVFTLPLSFFINNKPEKHSIRVEIQPYYIDINGEKVTLLPAKELGLPSRYQKPWGTNRHKLLLYKTKFGPIWGLTAELIYELISLIK